MSGPVISSAAIDATARPRLVDAVMWGYIGTAILNLVVGAWTLAFIPAALDHLRAEGRALDPRGVVLAFALVAIGSVVFSGAIVVLSVRLRRGRSWARPALLTVSLLSLVAIVTGGAPGFAIIVLLAVLAFLVTRKPVTSWLHAAKGLPSP